MSNMLFTSLRVCSPACCEADKWAMGVFSKAEGTLGNETDDTSVKTTS
jgi:hypothetical protein